MFREEYNGVGATFGFGILDSDEDGFLCRKEFGVKAQAHFDMLDADQDGKETKQEHETGWSPCVLHQFTVSFGHGHILGMHLDGSTPEPMIIGSNTCSGSSLEKLEKEKEVKEDVE